MKILILLLLISSQAFAGITMVILERNPAKEAYTYNEKGDVLSTLKHEEFASAQVYGLLKNGAPKTVFIPKAKLAKLTGLENCESFSLNREAIKEIIYFDVDGNLLKIDFHMGDTFEVKTFEGEALTSQVLSKMADLKAILEAE